MDVSIGGYYIMSEQVVYFCCFLWSFEFIVFYEIIVISDCLYYSIGVGQNV